MSTVKANNHQVGQSATPSQNLTWYQPTTPDGTVRLGVGNSGATTGDVITASSTGITVPSLSASNTFGFKNRIINGGMTIDQRNAGAATANTINGYTIDRWFVNQSTTGKLIAQQNAGAVAPPAGYKNYLGVTSQSAYSVGASDFYLIQQIIEGYNVSDLAWGTAGAKAVTLSFYVYSSLTGTFGGSLANYLGTASYPFTYTIPSANTWTQISVSIVGDTGGTWNTNNSGGIQVIFGLGVGSTNSGAAGSWNNSTGYFSATGATSVVGTNGATFYITGVQLEVGSQATSFDFRSIGQELALCQRYYYTNYIQGTSPGTATTTNIIYRTLDGIASYATIGCYLKTSMRAVPTTTVYSSSGASGYIRDVNSAADRVAYSQIAGTEYIAFGVNSISLPSGTGIQAYFTASSEL